MAECSMSMSFREFLRLADGAGSGTALSGLIASGINLAPAVARAPERRIRNAKTTPRVCPFCSVGCATSDNALSAMSVSV
jgi:anaerobic selenocysteine-containing dehydrogenase